MPPVTRHHDEATSRGDECERGYDGCRLFSTRSHRNVRTQRYVRTYVLTHVYMYICTIAYEVFEVYCYFDVFYFYTLHKTV